MSKNDKKNPLSGIIAGIMLLVIGTVVLWLNEGDYVANCKAVKDVSENVINISSENVDSSNNGKLVCLNGDFKILDENVEDPMLLIGTNTAKLSRIVEVYQWEESEDSKQNYTYDKKWSEDLIDSSNFHDSGYSNPSSKAYENENYYASEVKVGAFKLSNEQLKELETDEKLTIDSSKVLPENYKINDIYITNSKDINNPEIGDIRIHYEYNNYKDATILAVQQNDSFINFVSDNGKNTNRVDEGKMNSDEVIQKITEENNALKWTLRIIGTLAVILGYISIIGPISKLATFIPFLGGIVSTVLDLIAALVGLIHSIIVIAIAWFLFRPVLSIILIIVVILIIFIIRWLIKHKKE